MPAQSLNHYTIKVRDLERTRNFYQEVVGLKVGDRPPLPFPGYWLYCGDIPTVHLIGHRAEDPVIPDGPSDPAPTGLASQRPAAHRRPQMRPALPSGKSNRKPPFRQPRQCRAFLA